MHLIRRCVVIFVLIALARTGVADQAIYVSKENAERAAALLTKVDEVRMYCPPCGDTRWQPLKVGTVIAHDAGYENFYEVMIDEAPMDLAYMYMPADGKWVNVAMHLGITVQDVPAALDETVKGTLPEYFRAYYLGAINETLKIRMEFSKEGEDVYGAYVYEGKETPLRLNGTVDLDGGLTITELLDEKKTGLFNGELDAEAKSAKGEWQSADREKRFPFTLTRVARQQFDEKSEQINGRELMASFDYPVFEFADVALNTRLNDAIQKALRARHETMAKAMKEMEQAESKPAETVDPSSDPVMPFSIMIGDYTIAYVSDKFVSLHFVVYEDGGGAHPNTFSLCVNLSLQADAPPKSISIGELASTPAAMEVISSYCLVELKEAEASLVVNGEIKSLNADDLSAFTLDAKNLTFHFDPYAVASYAEGPFEVTVPLEAVKEGLNVELLKTLGLRQ